MGFKDKDGGPLLPFTTSEEAFNHWRECTKGQLCDYSGLSYARLRNSAGIQWPCNEKAPDGTPRLYTDFKFMTGARGNTERHEQSKPADAWGYTTRGR